MTFVAHAVAVEKLILFVKLLLQGIGVKKAHLLHCMVYEGLACHFSDLYSFGITMENKN